MKRKRNDRARRSRPGRTATAASVPQEPSRVAHRVRQVAFGLALVGAGLGPLAPAFEGNPVLRLLIQTFFFLAGAMWVISMALEGRVRIRGTGLEAPLLLLAGALVCATVNAAYKHPAILTLFSWLSAMVAFVFLVNETRSRPRRLLVLSVVGAVTFVVSFHGLHQIAVEFPRARALFAEDRAAVLRELKLPADVAFDLEGRLGKDRIFSTFLLPNSLAGMLVLVAPALLGLFLDWRKSRPSSDENGRYRAKSSSAPSPGRAKWQSYSSLILRVGLILPVLAALYFTMSKGGWLAFLLSACAFAIWVFGALLWRRRLQVFAACVGLLLVGCVAQASGLLPPLRDYFGSSSVRYGYWRAGLSIFADHPLVGAGLDNFADFYATKKQPQDQETRRAHNDYVQIAAETGLIGLATFTSFWVLFWRRVRRVKGEPVLAEPESLRLSAGSVAGVLALSALIFAVEALCGGTLRTSPGFWGWEWLFALWAGCAVFLLVSTQSQGPLAMGRTSYATIGLGCGIIGFLLHSFVDFDHYVGGTLQTAWILMAVFLSARMSEERPYYVVDRAIGPGTRLACVLGAAGAALLLLYGFVLPVVEGQTLYGQALEPGVNRSEKQRRLDLEEAIRKDPLDAHNHALLSDVCLMQWLRGDRTSAQNMTLIFTAISNATEAIRLDPVRSEYYTRLGRLYEIRWRQQGFIQDYQDAKGAYLKAEELFPSNPDTALNLGRLYDLAGSYDFALHKYIRARRLSEEQYHIFRKFNSNPAELVELDARIEALQAAVTTHTLPPPLAFRQPRLLGWRHDMALPPAEPVRPTATP